MENYLSLNVECQKLIESIEGPILIFGAGGFIGVNTLMTLQKYRSDVFGVSQDHLNNWRFSANKIPHNNLRTCDITQASQLRNLFHEIKPKTIINLSAFGAYSKQREYDKIYMTNFVGSVDIIEVAKEFGFSALVQAGSSSEYGFNSNGPSEKSELIPNSHYSVSKAAIFQAIKYYGKIENLPVCQLRFYSVYGPWEEPDRLIPALISKALDNSFPPLVDGEISRDFIFIKDVVSAIILAVVNIEIVRGAAINIGSGKNTTIMELAKLVKDIFEVEGEIVFGKMPKRRWDTKEWFGNIEFASASIGWKPTTCLVDGLRMVAKWQQQVDFKNAFWNYTNLQ